MIKSGNTCFSFYVLVLAIFCLSASAAFAQGNDVTRNREFCSQNNYNGGDRNSFRELRELTIPASSLLTVDGRQNGGISIKGSDRADVLIRACVQTWNGSDDVLRSRAKNVLIETSPVVRAAGVMEDSDISVSYEILVPRLTNLKLMALNGGIGIAAVEGSIDFETQNGGVSLSEVAGDVRGRTTNGGVSVRLFGNTWRGRGLDVQTTNGGVNLSMPENYAAHVETGTVNGGFQSDISALSVERERGYGWRNSRLSKDINGGGAPIRVVTTNGGVRINSSK